MEIKKKNGLILLGLIPLIAFLPVSAQLYHDFPPTPAFRIIKGDTGNVTAKNYYYTVNIKGGTGVSVTADNQSKTITITSKVTNGTKITALTCPNNSQLHKVNGSGFFFCAINNSTGAGSATLDTMQNIGGGQSSIYAGNTSNTNFQFKTINCSGSAHCTNGTSLVTIKSDTFQNNTGTNLGTSGIGIFSGMSGSILQFLKLISTSNYLSVTSNSTNVILSISLKVNNGTCTGINNFFNSFDNRSGTFVCSKVTGFLTNAILSINGQNGPAITILNHSNATSITNSSNTITLSLKPNVVLTNGSTQTITKPLITSNTLQTTHLYTVNQYICSPYTYCNFNNKTNSKIFFGVNGTSQQEDYNGTDEGLITQKEINYLSARNLAGSFYYNCGNYTFTTPVFNNFSSNHFKGCGYEPTTTGGIVGKGTLFKFQLNGAQDGWTNTAKTGNNWGTQMEDISMTRNQSNSARYILACFSNHPCFHPLYNNLFLFDNLRENFALMTLQGADFSYLQHIILLDPALRNGSESQTELLHLSANVETDIVNSHISGDPISPENVNAYDGINFGTDTMDWMMGDTFDYLKNAWLQQSPLSSVCMSNINIFTVVNTPNHMPNPHGKSCGDWHYSGQVFGGSSMQRYIVNDTQVSMNFSKTTDYTSGFILSPSSLILTNHMENYTGPNANGTLQLEPNLNYTNGGNNTAITTSIMLGNYTMVKTLDRGVIQVWSVNGWVSPTTTSTGCVLTLRYGLVPAPPNASSTIIGTKAFPSQQLDSAVAGNEIPITVGGVIRGLLTNTLYWIAYQATNANGATGSCGVFRHSIMVQGE